MIGSDPLRSKRSLEPPVFFPVQWPIMKETVSPFISTGDEGSFARLTWKKRFPSIVDGVAASLPDSDPYRKRLELLKAEIAGGVVTDPFADGPALFGPEETAAWREELAPRLGRSWGDAPFYFIEAYLYLRILLASGYYDEGSDRFHADPFQPQKDEELARLFESRDWEDAARVFGQAAAEGPSADVLEELLLFMLKGNRIDLSNLNIAEHGRAVLHRKDRNDLLIDHCGAIASRILESGRVDVVLDNAGQELASDLVFADYVLSAIPDSRVILHAKNAPLFVSDAMVKDVAATVSAFEGSPAFAGLGGRLASSLEGGRLSVKAHGFWNGPKHFTELPTDLASELAGSDLVLIKGDANFRRLLEDRALPHDVRLAKLAGYFPADFAVLRTMKSEITADIDAETEKRVSAADPAWLVDGKWGVVQFVEIGSAARLQS